MEYKEIREVFNRLYYLMDTVIEMVYNGKSFDTHEYQRVFEETTENFIFSALDELATLASTNTKEQFTGMLKDIFGYNAPFPDALIELFSYIRDMMRNEVIEHFDEGAKLPDVCLKFDFSPPPSRLYRYLAKKTKTLCWGGWISS